MGTAREFVDLCLAQAGERYVYGAEVRLDDPNPPGPWDCSELTQWAAHRVGVTLPDGSLNQLRYCEKRGTVIPLDHAIRTPGALLFRQRGRDRHVAVSLGNGKTIEARGSAYGVGSFDTAKRTWTHAALVPDLDYTIVPPAPAPTPPSVPAWPRRYLKRVSPMMRGEDVRTYQEQMRRRGWKVDADGWFGAECDRITRLFQAEKGLEVDGVVGQKTWDCAFRCPL